MTWPKRKHAQDQRRKWRQQHEQVAYLLAADIVSGPLPIRLRAGNPPVISTRNPFSRPRPCLLPCL